MLEAIWTGNVIDVEQGAMQLMGQVGFAPRNLASKFQLLDPTRYLTLEPGIRKLVLRDALSSFGSLLAVGALLDASGVGDVSLNPLSPNFMTVRVNNTRFDLTGGLKTEVQFLAKMIRGVYNEVTGAGNLPDPNPLSVAGHYARGKLSPLPSEVWDLLEGRDYKGQKLSEKTPAQIAVEDFAPMTVGDLYDAYQDSGWTGALGVAAPSIIGIKVGSYPDKAKADWLDEPLEYRVEQQHFNEPRSFLEPKRSKDPDVPDETVQEFASRKSLADQWMQQYGRALPMSDEYRGATPDQQKAALDLLKKRIVIQSSKDEEERDLSGLVPEVVMADVKEQEQNKQERKEERKRAIKPQKPNPPTLPTRQTP